VVCPPLFVTFSGGAYRSSDPAGNQAARVLAYTGAAMATVTTVGIGGRAILASPLGRRVCFAVAVACGGASGVDSLQKIVRGHRGVVRRMEEIQDAAEIGARFRAGGGR
jgi:hypothetical protein